MLWQQSSRQLLLPIQRDYALWHAHAGLLPAIFFVLPAYTCLHHVCCCYGFSLVNLLVIMPAPCLPHSVLLQTLVSVSTIGTQPDLSEQQLIDAVMQELSVWFGPQQVSTWNHLRTYRIPFAQPNQTPPTNFSRPVSLGAGLFVCGDHRDSATFDAALRSGRRAAEALLQEQGGAGVAAAGGSRAVVQLSV
jgi:hypothetical protein